MDFTKIFDLGYLFTITPGMDFAYMNFFVILFALMIVAGVGVYLSAKFSKNDLYVRAVRSMPWTLAVYGLFGYIFLFFRSQNAPYLSMRIWFLLYMAWTIYAIYSAIISARKDYFGRKSMQIHRRSQSKGKTYLPQKKVRRKKK